MSNDLVTEVQDLVRVHLASEVACYAVNDQPRVACVLPLHYASGDAVTVWVERRSDGWHVTDYGESLIESRSRKAKDATEFQGVASRLVAPFGVRLVRGELVAMLDADGLADAVMRLATAAALVSQSAEDFRLPKIPADREHRFAQEVESELRSRQVPVEREKRLEGSSGHEHRATIYVPSSEAILEPIGPSAHYNQITAVYAKFGDLSHKNGYRRFSLVDDREGQIGDDLTGMLVQVSDVVSWTRRDDWLLSIL